MVKRFRARPLGDSEYLTDRQSQLYQPVVSQAGVSLRVGMGPVYIPRKTTITSITFRKINVGGAATNLRLGIYADNGNSPEGGAILFDSGDIAADADTGPIEATISSPVEALPGYLWGALMIEDTVIDYNRGQANPYLDQDAGDFLEGCRYQIGSITDFTDPCPTVTAETFSPYFALRHTGFR